eukprot:snap_masked-scaffold_11-processed-gene-12.55-mRNA-1 protein AED:1.00 eAED:1.00 QI:0/0/0/0/1/1/2/0/65
MQALFELLVIDNNIGFFMIVPTKDKRRRSIQVFATVFHIHLKPRKGKFETYSTMKETRVLKKKLE